MAGAQDASVGVITKGVGTRKSNGPVFAKREKSDSTSSDLSQKGKTKNGKAKHLETMQNLSRSKKHYMLSRKDHVFKFNKDEIFKCACVHEKYVKGGMNLTNLPKFEDLLSYETTEEVEKDLWKIEISRLVEVAESNKEFLFDGNALFGTTDLAGFERLSGLADQILCNFEIINHDNALLVLEHCRWLGTLETAVRVFKDSRTTLITRYEQDEERVKVRRPKTLDDPEENLKAYFYLVDYLTGVTARLVVRSASCDHWNNHMLAILAKWSAKLKIIAHDPALYATTSLSAASDLFARMKQAETMDDLPVLKLKVADAKEHKSNDTHMDLDEETDTNITGFYYQEHWGYRLNLSYLLKHAATALYASEKTGNAADCFEACTLVYETGLERWLTTISSDRGNDISASSSPMHTKCSYTALELLMRNTKKLADCERSPANVDIKARITWSWAEGRTQKVPNQGYLSTSTMDELISLIVPFSLADSHSAIEMGFLIGKTAVETEEEDPLKQFEAVHFQAKYHIATGAWLDKERRSKSNSHMFNDPEVRPVSKSPLERPIRAGTKFEDLHPLNSVNSFPTTEGILDANKSIHIRQRYEKDLTKMKLWVISETDITVPCFRYTRIMLVIAAIIVSGGLAIPFSVQNRIVGVDPFNITIFAWIVAGFILLVAKSRYISVWPWHDFLRGHVVCKSISDVEEVTSVNSQMILTYLLHNERKTTLISKGPYNGMFARRAEQAGEGFSIDIPVDLSTMLASGFIVLKVLSERGEHLICLDVRKDADWDLAMRNHRANYLACMDMGQDLALADEDEDRDDVSVNVAHTGEPGRITRRKKGDGKVWNLMANEFRWSKVLGLYVANSSFG